MGHSFTVILPKEISVEGALQKIESNCDSFRGGTELGSFSKAGVSGRYRINGSTVAITLTDKPWAVSWRDVEDKIRSLI